MNLKTFLTRAVAGLLISTGYAHAALDPAGCTSISDADMVDLGYEPVTLHGATPANNADDDRAAIQTAIETAHANRRVVYFPPGEYAIGGGLKARQEAHDTNGNDGETRFGIVLMGSYCGTSRPIIRLKDGVDTGRAVAAIADEPTAVVAFWRNEKDAVPTDGPDLDDGGHNYNNVIKNLKIVTGANSGAVGIRHGGAESSMIAEVTVVATGGFAGLYNTPASGGVTYDAEIIGGQYGVYNHTVRNGGNTHVGGKFSGQEVAAIAQGGQAPFVLVGAEITSSTGNIIRYIAATLPLGGIKLGAVDSSGNISIIDSKITVTGGDEIIKSLEKHPSVYIRNSYFRGSGTIIRRTTGVGNLLASDPDAWTYINEYAGSGPMTTYWTTSSKLVAGTSGDQTYYNGALTPYSANVTVGAAPSDPPLDLISRHTYPVALCNPERTGAIWAHLSPYNANPDTVAADSAAIQAAINAGHAASPSEHVVFLRAGLSGPAGAIGKYKANSTIELKAGTRLCGVAPWNTIIDATGWSPSTATPILSTVDDANANTVIADFKTLVPRVTGSGITWDPHVYNLLWRAGKGVIRGYYSDTSPGSGGDRVHNRFVGQAGGKVFAFQNEKSEMKTLKELPEPFTYKLYDSSGNPVISPAARLVEINGTTNRLSFYPLHIQFPTPPRGAQIEVINARNVNFYGVKSESTSILSEATTLVRSNPPGDLPAWMKINGGSDNIFLTGYEGLTQVGAGRGLIEVQDSTNVSISSMGRRNSVVGAPETGWFFAKNIGTGEGVPAKGFLSLFKTDLAPYTEDYTPPPTPTTRMLSRWTLDDGTGTTALDAAGLVNGSLTGAGTWVDSGVIGTGSISLSGANTGANQFVTVSAVPNLLPATITVSAWLKLSEAPTSTGVIVRKIKTAGDQNYAYDLTITGGGTTPAFRVSNGTSGFSVSANSGIALNTWTLITGTLGADGVVRLYINGVAQTATATGASITDTNPGTLRIGASALATAQINGTFDDIRIYTGALTAPEILALYEEGDLGGGEPEEPTVIDPPASFALKSTSPCLVSWTYTSDKMAKIDGFRVNANGVNTTEFPRDLRLARCSQLGLSSGSNSVHLKAYRRNTVSDPSTSITITR